MLSETGKLTVTDRCADVDVCVLGGGLSGLCAALAAAREGVRTVLVQDRPVLGGNASTEMRIPPSGAGHFNPWANETGIIEELLSDERAHCQDRGDTGMVNAQWDIILYDKVRREENLQLFLNTHALGVNMDGPRIRSVVGVQMGSEKVWEFEAELFIECTGDGSIGAAAGVPVRVGQESKSEYGESLAPDEPWDWFLGSSLMFRARDVGRPVEFTPPPWAEVYEGEDALYLRSHKTIDSGYWWIEVGFPWDPIRDNERIRDELMRHVLGVWDHVKNRCSTKERARNYVLDWIGMLPAKRESRRFVGAHVMTQPEVQARTLYPDRIAYGGWIIDDHIKGGILNRDEGPNPHGHLSLTPYLVPPYSVTLRSLYAPQVENLLFAGRLLSASRLVFNSLRVMRSLAVIGQAAGTAAARCVEAGRRPAELASEHVSAIQQSLLRQDCYIPCIRNEDPADVARLATVTASSASALVVEPVDDGMSLGSELAQVLPLSARPDRVRLHVRNDSEAPRHLSGTLHRAVDIWDLFAFASDGVARIECTVPGNFCGVTEAGVEGDLEVPGLYWLRLDPAEDVTWLRAKPLPGMTSAQKRNDGWALTRVALAADVLPLSRPFEPANMVNGVSRPEAWPNVWLSAQGLPQSCTLTLREPTALGTIQITWGLNLSRTWHQVPGFFRAPEVARDYRVTVQLADGSSAAWAEVQGNYQRRCIHETPESLCDKDVGAIRIDIAATNGASCVELAEVRAYPPARGDRANR